MNGFLFPPAYVIVLNLPDLENEQMWNYVALAFPSLILLPEIWCHKRLSKACTHSSQTKETAVPKGIQCPHVCLAYGFSKHENLPDEQVFQFQWLLQCSWGFPWLVPSGLQTVNALGQSFCSLVHFNYCKGWCTLYITKGATTTQPCALNAALGLDLFPRYGDVQSLVSCKISYCAFQEKWVLTRYILLCEKVLSIKVVI